MSHQKVLATLVATFCLIASPAFAVGVLDGNPYAYNDGMTVWSGSDTYDNGSLSGVIEYAVMTNADFQAAFPGAGPASGPPSGLTYDPAGAMVYLYQVFNSGEFDVTAEIVGLANPGVDIGQFISESTNTASSLFGFDSGGKALWNFASPPIAQNGESYILAYSANYLPQMGMAFTIDHGTYGLSSVPVAGSDPIPEPTSVVLLAAGLLGLGIRRR